MAMCVLAGKLHSSSENCDTRAVWHDSCKLLATIIAPQRKCFGSRCTCKVGQIFGHGGSETLPCSGTTGLCRTCQALCEPDLAEFDAVEVDVEVVLLLFLSCGAACAA